MTIPDEQVQKYWLLFEESPDAILMLDNEGRFTDANPAACTLFGYSREDMLQHTIFDTVTEAQRAELTQAMQVWPEEKRLRGEYSIRHKDGQDIFVEYSALYDMQPDTHLIFLRDVTHKKQLERHLRESEARYKMLAENAGDVIVLYDAEMCPLYISPACERMVGYTPADFQSMSVFDLVHPDDIDNLADTHTRSIEAQADTYTEAFRCQHKDGHYIWVESIAHLEYDDNGHVTQALVTTRDITERKQMEDNLRRSEANLRAMLDSTWQSFTLVDREYRIIDADQKGRQAAEQIFGKQMQPGDSIYDFVLPRDHDSFTTNFARALSGETIALEKSFPVGDDQHIYFEIVYYPVTNDDDDVIGVCMSNQNITQRKRMEDELHQSETRLKALFQAVPDLIFRNSGDGTYLDYHAPHDDLLRVPPQQFVGRKTQDVALANNPTQHIKHIQLALETGEQQTFEYEMDLNGQPVIFEARVVISGPDETLTIVRDITERKHAQQREFDLALEKERWQLLATFIENAAHEFRTPLSTILTSTHIMTRHDDPAKRQEKADRINTQVERITRLVDMLLLMVQLESVDVQLDVPVDIGGTIEGVCQKMTSRYEDRTELHCDIKLDLPPTMGHAEYLSNALQQIIDNAYRFTPAGGAITILADATEHNIEIEICDTGPGIPADALPHIFETFWRQDTSHSTPGLGLGLAIASKIIELHQGTIDVESNPGSGTCVRVLLPL